MSANENAILLCQHLTSAGHRCHMPLSAGHPSLCTHHLRVAKREAARYAETTRLNADHLSLDNSAVDTQLNASRLNRETVANELLAGAENLSTPASVNLFLGNLLKQVAHNRISRKNAIAMAYISQLLLNSISVMQREARDIQAAKDKEPVRIVVDMPRPRRDIPPNHNNDDNNGAGRHQDVAAEEKQSSRDHRGNHSHQYENQVQALGTATSFEVCNIDSSVSDPALNCSTNEPANPHLSPVIAPTPPQAPHSRATTVLYTPDEQPPFSPRPSVFRRGAGPRGRLSSFRRGRYDSSSRRVQHCHAHKWPRTIVRTRVAQGGVRAALPPFPHPPARIDSRAQRGLYVGTGET